MVLVIFRYFLLSIRCIKLTVSLSVFGCNFLSYTIITCSFAVKCINISMDMYALSVTQNALPVFCSSISCQTGVSHTMP